MTSEVLFQPRSEPVSQTLTDSSSSPVITVKTSQHPESLQATQTISNIHASETSIIIIEGVDDRVPVTTTPTVSIEGIDGRVPVTTTPTVSSNFSKPEPKNRVLAISAPIPESSLKFINELQEARTDSTDNILHLVESDNVLQDAKKEHEVDSSSGAFKCDNCDYSSNNKHYLKQHVDLVHNAGRPYKCPYCDYAGKRNHSLREHLVVHSNERPYECIHCNATFRKKGHLTNHVKLHASPKVIKCSLCADQIILPNQVSYMDHLQSVHNTNKLFACDMCQFITGTEDNIKHHMMQYHSESRLYQCGMCSYVTKDLNLISVHIESHSKPNISLEKKTSQPPPFKLMSDGSLPSVHAPGRTPLLIKCSECGYTAGDRENMKSHMVQHIQNTSSDIFVPKPEVVQPALPPKASYKCTDCAFVSADATAFIHHMLIHKTIAKEQKVDVQSLYDIKPVSKENTCRTGNAPFYHDERTGRFICTICGYGCEYQRTIKSHIWKHSGNQDIAYPMFQNGPLSVYEDNVSRSQPQTPIKTLPTKESSVLVKSVPPNIQIEPPVTSYAPGTTICKIKISEDKMIAYMKEAFKPPFKLHEFSKMENKKPVYTNSVLKADPRELAVVVETVKAVPSSQGFTGMESQPNSPKRSLSPVCAEESEPKWKKICNDKASQNQFDNSEESVASPSTQPTLTNDNSVPTEEESTESALALLALKKERQEESSLVNAPYHNTRSRGTVHKRKMSCEDDPDLALAVELELDNQQSLSNTKQSPKQSPGGAGGICSSLLAVIEQLRERSKFEVDAENYTKAAGKRTSSRRRSRRDSSDDELPTEFAHSIEKISDEGEIRYRCKFCHYSNPKPLLIRIHMRLHKSKKPFECSLCVFVARSMEGLQVHMIQHCKVRTYQCKLCPSAFNYKSQLRAHMRAHNEKDTYICDFCDFVTSNLTSYHQHTLIHSDNLPSYFCSTCNKTFSSKTARLRHQPCGFNHGDSVEEELDLSSDDDTAPSTKELKCPHCEFSTNDIAEFTAHSSNHADEDIAPVPLKCELCDFTAVSNRSLKSHMKRHINDQRYVQQPLEQYKCNLCGYVCHHLPSLKSHMWRHASDRNYSYEFTNEVINAAIDYDIRVDGRDLNDPEILERVLSSERKIVEGRLNNTEHPGGRIPECLVTFRCCQCGYETINKPELNVHMRSHSDIIQHTLEVPHQVHHIIKDINTSESLAVI